MADNCYNLFKFYGNDKVIEQVKEWKSQLNSVKATDEDPECMRAIRTVFYSDAGPDEELNYGSKWVHQDDDSIGPDDNEIGLLSAWGPPDELHKKIASMLYKLDKHAVVANLYNLESGSMGAAYATPYDSENAYYQHTEVDVEESDFEDEDYDPQADMEEAEQRLIEAQTVILDYLMDDMRGTAKVIKKFLPDLNVEWDFYK